MIAALPRIFMMPRQQAGRLRTMIATVAVATVVVGGAALITGEHTVPISPAGTDIWIATNGNDATCVRGNQALPCLSLDKAYSLAQCGDDISIGAGTYSAAQTFTYDASKASCSSYIHFTGSGSHASVFTGTLDWNAAWVWVENITLNHSTEESALTWYATADHIKLTDSNIFASWTLRGSDVVTLDGNDFDGQYSSAIAHNQILPVEGGTDGNTDITITNNTFQRYDPQTSGNHSEAMFIDAYTNGMLIEGNTFDNNGTTAHLFFTWFNGSATDSSTWPQNICVRGNTFTNNHNDFYHIQARTEIDVSVANIDVEDSPSNTYDSSGSLASFSLATCSPYPPF